MAPSLDCDAVVQDHELDARTVFNIETAGFAAHPARLLEEQPKDAGCVDHDREYVRYTTYDLRREYDTITLRTHPDIMVLSGETRPPTSNKGSASLDEISLTTPSHLNSSHQSQRLQSALSGVFLANVKLNTSILSATAIAGLEVDLQPFEFGISTFEGEDGFTLLEGASIARYVASLAPESGLLGNSIKDAALVDQWVHFAEHEISIFTDFIWQLVERFFPEQAYSENVTYKSSPHSRSRPFSRTNTNETFSALPPEPIRSVQSSPGATTAGLPPNDSTTTNSHPIPIGRSNFPQSGGAHMSANTPQDSILLSSSTASFGTSPTPSVILTPHHHYDHAKASSAPTSPTERVSPSPPASLGPASSNEPSALSRLLHQRADPRGDITPPSGSPRKWWSRSPSNERSVSPSRGRPLPQTQIQRLSGRTVLRRSKHHYHLRYPTTYPMLLIFSLPRAYRSTKADLDVEQLWLISADNGIAVLRVFPVRLHHDYCDEGVLQDESGAMSLAGISVLLVSLCTDHTIPRPRKHFKLPIVSEPFAVRLPAPIVLMYGLPVSRTLLTLSTS
ncbi:hypothetical protein P692DRAFT_201867222 [Suillus brevipes Sb2]|nr:hypothetical protein P692DRAFT_201867222 [Suillus brevipes Sb2]